MKTQNSPTLSQLFRSKYVDVKLLILAISLVVTGLFSLYSSTYNSAPATFMHQLWITLGGTLVTLVVFSLPNYIIKNYLVFPFYIFTTVLLVVTWLMGSFAKGSTAWLTISGWSLQPAELAKISLLLVLAKVISRNTTNLFNVWQFSKLFIYFLIPFILINLQPDFGTAMVVGILFMGVLFWAGVDAYYLTLLIFVGAMFIASLTTSVVAMLIVGSIAAIVLLLVFHKKFFLYFMSLVLIAGVAFGTPVIYENLPNHQQKRLETLLDPNSDPQGAGYNILQAMLAVGSGGIAGKGFKEGTLTQLKFIPEQHTDFIFSNPAEEFGFIGSAVLVFLLFALCERCITLARECKDHFNSTIAFGAATILFFHTMVNVGMVLGIMPVMGIPLPFFSKGGTFQLSNLLLIGLLLNAYKTEHKVDDL